MVIRYSIDIRYTLIRLIPFLCRFFQFFIPYTFKSMHQICPIKTKNNMLSAKLFRMPCLSYLHDYNIFIYNN